MQRSPLLPLHEAAGARLAARPEAADFTAALTFGRVPAEVAAATEGCALFDRTDRSRITLAGADTAGFLHRILAGEVRALGAGQGNRNLLLSPKGKVLFDFELTRLADDRFELSCGPGRDRALAESLDQYLFGEDVQIETTTDEHAPLELRGPRAQELVETLLGSGASPEPNASVEVDGLRVSQATVFGQGGVRLDGGPSRAPELWQALVEKGATPAGLVARDSLRAESCAALWGVDVDENVYPQEARLEAAFSLEKGCYIGQEVVAKIDTYGGLNKRLMLLAVSHDDPVARGTALTIEEGREVRELGLVTTWAYSFALDCGVVLGYVKRRHQEPGTSFRLSDGSGTARIVELPGN